MAKVTKAEGPTKAQLAQKVKELTAQLAFTYAAVDQKLNGAGSALMASGVLVELTALGGRAIVPPFVVLDGLSDDTIAAIRRDLVRSYQTATAQKPKGV